MTSTDVYKYLRGIRMGLFKPTFLKGPIDNKPYNQCNVMIGPYRCIENYGHQGVCISSRITFGGAGYGDEVEFPLGDFTVERWPDIRMKFERERHKRGEGRRVILWDTGIHSFSDDC